MKNIMKFIKIMLRFWLLMLALSIVCIHQTAADTTPRTPAAQATTISGTSLPANNDLRILTETSASNEESISKETPLTTPTSPPSPSGESLTAISTTSSSSTDASSNAPATITNQAKLSITTKTLTEGEEGEEKLANASNPNVDNDKSVTEERVINLKQVTHTIESVMVAKQQQQQQEQKQQITTDAPLKQETDIHIQSRGNAEKTKKTTTSTLATKKQLTTTHETPLVPITTTTPLHFLSTIKTALSIGNENMASTTNAPLLTTSNQANDNRFPATTEQLQQLHDVENNQDQITQTLLTDVKGDDFKHQTTTIETAPIINFNTPQIDSITNKEQKQQATQAMEDFKPLIQDVNEKLLKERTIFPHKHQMNHDEWKQNLMPNELDYQEHRKFPAKTQTEAYEHNINWSPYLHPAAPVTDFTGKLLQEQDGVITEIEQKFRLNEFAADTDNKPTKNPLLAGITTTTKTSLPPEVSPKAFSVNHEILKINKTPFAAQSPVQFIERRVKKSFDFPMHRMASDALHMQQHFDFANTKFNSNNNDPLTQPASGLTQPGQTLDATQQIRPQPEFSTTKFYNSKELYNEMLLHKSGMKQQHDSANVYDKELQELNNKPASLSLNSFAVLHSPKIAKLEEMHEMSKEPQQQHLQQQKSLAIKKVTVKATKHKDISTSSISSLTNNTSTSTSPNPTTTTTSTSTSTSKPSTTTTTTSTTTTTTAAPATATSTTEIPLATVLKTKKFQKELKRAKLLIKTMMPLQNSTTNYKPDFKSLQTEVASTAILDSLQSQMELSIASTTLKPNTLTTLKQSPTEVITNAQMSAMAKSTVTSAPVPAKKYSSPRPSVSYTSSSSSASSSSSSSSSATSTYPPKSSVKPIVRPRILSRLQEKINSLECELQNLPQDSHLWRGNETHELLLPIMTPENCKTDKDCTAMMVSWEGEAEIQSGDILIVEINDALLTPKDINLTTSAHNTQVYQVTRSGHEHCDVTEGILLDITPLIVDGRKLVTLYDKDLTEGVNLLIVVSELWGSQCVRLKVTTKTENCGENADCSGKGICYSDYDMEEYECQCCSGFAGPHCEEIDACTPSPCTNNGICVDLSQGHEGNSYQCLCPYGYTGKNCQYELDPCNPAECMNGGSCVGNSTHFRCECTPGYTGPMCQHSLNECESSPCVHGICVDQEDGFRCFCQPGFAGELCNFEYNECESNPCQNAGECIDHIGSYECHCTKGYTGNRCQIKVDFCANKPCPGGRRCIDHGNDYSCECLGGRNGPDCNEMQRTQCNVNPCTHGGTCWSSGDSFYCACRPGYTGTMCEDEFVVETVVSSSEFMVDDTSARNFNDKSFGSSVVLKSPIELHNAYTAAIVLALVIFFVALYLAICHCKVNQTYRKFSTRTYGFLPILGFRLRTKQATSKISRHWLSGKGLAVGAGATTTTQHNTTTTSAQRNSVGHLPTANASSSSSTNVGQLNERPFQRHLAMNLENDMYYTVDFSENSQHSPLIQ